MTQTVEVLYGQDPITGKLTDRPVGVQGRAVNWNDLAGMRAAGWIVEEVIQGDGAATTLVMRPPEGCKEEKTMEGLELSKIEQAETPETTPEPKQPRRGLPPRPACLQKGPARSPLGDRLYILQGRCWKTMGKPQSIQLNNGLRVNLRIEQSGTHWLCLAREGVYPSDMELSTILAHWPDPVGETTPPERFNHNAWFHGLSLTSPRFLVRYADNGTRTS